MIRNLIFDMGQVLMRWDPMFIAGHYVDDPAEAQEFVDELIVQPDWYLVDAGQIPEAEYRAKLAERAPEKWRERLLKCYDEFHIYMPPIAEMHTLANEAKAAGYGVYVLSNALTRFDRLIDECPTLQCIDNKVISAIEKMAKPDLRIYELALRKFGLPGDECVFIDDLQENIDGAVKSGIHGIRFDGDVAALRRKLLEMGVKLGTE